MLVVRKVLNNNVLVAAHPDYDEVVLIGKGLGFGKMPGDEVGREQAEKFFVLKEESEQKQYRHLMQYIDETFLSVMNDVMEMIEDKLHTRLYEHIHVALTDHLFYAIKRIKQGQGITNPFLKETELAYPKEFKVASDIREYLFEKLNVRLPDSEIGFITLHIHSGISNRSLQDVNAHTRLIAQLVEIIEERLQITVDRSEINYLRLVRHLHFAIERVETEQFLDPMEALKDVLQKEYPVCYTLSWNLIKVMQQSLKKQIPEGEAVYLTLHLQRLTQS
ncbi:glucose PTS transporter transcription antiterminator GlcT [Alkalicoccobacillus porphyridii]|uniref:Transcription antiterminator n=1 Tax=Alkalicoccobacillus porphyridii TaxID=2597270 RepID=A0A553ZTW9_9BACI|nr:transcription antiterminator [Alkalicoccobacillus porphyridii]TSB44766.1 transcription antiterminator [Alkalicoccobacillus porphyridii]